MVAEESGWPVVSGAGEVDLHSVQRFRSAMEQAEANSGGGILVDLSEVEFMDSSGLGVLIGRHRELAENGAEMRVVAGEAAMKILRLTSLNTVFSIYDSRREALADGSGEPS
ncbi:MAG: STAS domain-containing protein [Rubrobacter sp.]|nr:STAS domain-containing protein [Rubrobacter sp.]